MLSENQYYSYNVNGFPQGCRHCVKGEKLVLFVTGLCPRRCYFCPVSDEKYGRDVVFANERKVRQEEDLLYEGKLMQAQGAGITGGDPLMKPERTVASIKALKQQFGEAFHIHLYTSLNLVSEEALSKLHAAGLDEIRFHLDLGSSAFWSRLALVRQFTWDIGVELPLLPFKKEKIKDAIDFIQDKADFLVLNELELADNGVSLLSALGFKAKDTLSYAVQGSLEAGLELLDYIQEKKYGLKVHLCTAKLKDAVQLANRIKREAAGVRKPFDEVDEEGLLIRGALYLPELYPTFGYRQKLNEVDKDALIVKLKSLEQEIKRKFHLEDGEVFLDSEKPRILLSAAKVKYLHKQFQKLNLIPAIVKEYPTADQLEMEVELLE